MRKRPFHTSAKTKMALYALLFALLMGGRLLLPANLSPGSLAHHTLWESVAAMLALFVGLLALVRFYTRQDNVFLFIGAGFVGAGALDAYHAIYVNPALRNLFPFVSPAVAWNWNVSPTFLSILVFGSWLTWRREVETGWYGRMTGRRLFWLIVGLTLTNVLLFTLGAGTSTQLPLLHRLELFISATFYLWSLVSYLAKGQWPHDVFEFWLVVALLVNFAAQTLFTFASQHLFDSYFQVAQWLKVSSYVAVLMGLLGSMVAIFKQAEQGAIELQRINQTLQREIAERQRAETAEYAQRQLAEALRQAGIALSATLDFDELLSQLLEQIAHVLPYDTANVMLRQGEQVQIVAINGYGRPHALSPLSEDFNLADMPSLAHMLATDQPLVIPDTSRHPQWVRGEASPHVRSWAGAPISGQGEIIAFLALNSSQPHFYQPADAARLAAFAGQAAIAIQNSRLYESLQRRVAELATLNEISQGITASLELTTTLTLITTEATRLLHVAATSVVLLDRQRGDLWFAAAAGEAAEFVLGKRLILGQGVLGWVAQHGRPLLVADAQRDGRYFPDFDQASGFTARSLLCVPLQANGQTIGAIEALNKATGPFDADDLRLLTLLAGPAAPAIENARLYAQARQEIAERQRVEAALEAERATLAQRVMQRTTELSAANAELARAARLKDEFLAAMSHELRTPLNAILGISEALQEEVYGTLYPKQVQALQTIGESGHHLLTLINDILDLSKIEAGKLTLEVMPVSVAEVCQASLRFVRQEAHKKCLTVQAMLDPTVKTVLADERRLKQILVNLLSNAVKFTPEGGEIGLEVTGETAVGVLHFAVWDRGIGIGADDLRRLFHPFVQLDSRLARQYSGTGLGLSLVFRMTELHGGHVSVISEPGVGSRFTVSLPWAEGQGLAPAPDKPMANLPPLIASPPLVVLIAEDNEANLRLLSDYLHHAGYGVVVARNGEEAIERAREDHPDLILMDVQMPVVDGLAAMRRIRTDVGLTQTPIIALTALVMPGDRERCLVAGANAYLSKPVHLPQLAAVMAEVSL